MRHLDLIRVRLIEVAPVVGSLHDLNTLPSFVGNAFPVVSEFSVSAKVPLTSVGKEIEGILVPSHSRIPW